MEYKIIRGFDREKKALNCMDMSLLNEQFRTPDEHGIYRPFQRIYGFRKGPRQSGEIQWYIINYHILKKLACLDFDSYLDVGAAEGYTAYLIGKLFGVKVSVCDFCEELCNKSRELFGIDSKVANGSELPYKDNEFDVVLCTETLEHIPDLPKALSELIRVSRKAVVITVPHESPELIERNITGKGKGSSHVHSFDLNSLDHLEYPVIATRFYSPSPLLLISARIIEAVPRKYNENMKYPKIVIDGYNAFIPVLSKIFGKRVASLLIRLDELVCRFTTSYNGVSYVIIKDPTVEKKQSVKVSPRYLMDFSVPYHYLGKTRQEKS